MLFLTRRENLKSYKVEVGFINILNVSVLLTFVIVQSQ
jgi:hypothetical protein